MTKSDSVQPTAGGRTLTPDGHRLESEANRNEAEQRKLDLEAQEIAARLSEPWYRGKALLQVTVGGVVASALLAAWIIGYLQPILSKQQEIAKLESLRLDAENKLQAQRLAIQEKDINTATSLLLEEGKRHRAELEALTANNEALRASQAQLEEQLRATRTQQVALADEYISLATSANLPAAQRQQFIGRAEELTQRGIFVEERLAALREALATSSDRAAELRQQALTGPMKGLAVNIVYTSPREADATRISGMLTELGATPKKKLTSPEGNVPHAGHIYYNGKLRQPAADHLAGILTKFGKFKPVESSVLDDDLSLWVV